MRRLPLPNFNGSVHGLPNHNHLVGVYGTLKRGEPNHRLIKGAYHVGLATVNGHKLVSYGAFPAMTPDDEDLDHELPIELFAVTDAQLLAMDRLEGHPDWFVRSMLPTMGAPLGTLPWVYVMPTHRVREDAPLIETGVWETAVRA